MGNPIKVSVLCVTYNQEKYIRQALDSFVGQVTDFPFEIVVHDDASTDGTADIIREYEAKYPQLVHGIYQSENQYSKNPNMIGSFAVPDIHGKYVAFCEGDDFWIDSKKIQKQYEAMEENPGCRLCACRTSVCSEEGAILPGKTYPPMFISPGRISSEDFLRLTPYYPFQMASFFFRADDYQSLMLDPPAFYQTADVGDEPLMLYFGHLGDAFFIDAAMACHRDSSVGSWGKTCVGEKLTAHYDKMIAMADAYDQYTQGRFPEAVRLHRLKNQFYRALNLGNYRTALRKDYRPYFQMLSRNARIAVYLNWIAPGSVERIQTLLKKIRGKL